MHRLIDADAIKLKKGFFEKVDNVPKFYEWLGEQPTVDAVQVVRCGDCRHYDHYMGSSIGSGVCSREKRKMNPIVDCDWYCADGERREE